MALATGGPPFQYNRIPVSRFLEPVASDDEVKLKAGDPDGFGRNTMSTAAKATADMTE